MNFAVRNSTKFLYQPTEYRLVNVQWTVMRVSGELVSLVVGSSVVKTWKWISLWNHIHRPSDSGRARHLPCQRVRSDCKLTTSILFHFFFSHLYGASCCYQSFLLPTDAQENYLYKSIKIYILNTHWGGSYIIILSTQWMNIMNIRKTEEYKPWEADSLIHYFNPVNSVRY